MFCKYCGKQLPDTASFCTACGRQLTAPPAEPETNDFDETLRMPETPPVVSTREAAKSPQKKKKSAGKIIFTVVLLLLVGGLIAGGIFAWTEYIQPMLEDIGQSQEKDDDAKDPDRDPAGDPTAPGENTPVSPDGNAPTIPSGSQPSATVPSASEPLETEPPHTNPYSAYIASGIDYILPDSDRQYFNIYAVTGMTELDLRIAQQEIYARHGDVCGNADLQEYFVSRSWYRPSDAYYSLNTYEETNLILLETALNQLIKPDYMLENPYMAIRNDYVCPQSNSRYLNALDARNLSIEALCVAKNEIYARKGCVFPDDELQAYFSTKLWYVPSIPLHSFSSVSLNKYEQNNLILLECYERKFYQVPLTSENEYQDEYRIWGNRDYIFPDSSYRYIEQSELWGMNENELELARNEIYARNGYTFSDQALREYFCTKSWYFPNTAVGDQSNLGFSDVELANIRMMRNYEDSLTDD